MKFSHNKINIFVCLSCIFILSCCVTLVQGNKNFVGNTNKKIAILQPIIRINNLPNLVDSILADSIFGIYESIDINEESKYYSLGIQDSAQNYIMNHTDKFCMSLQNVDTTNAILAVHKINYKNLPKQDKGKICKILGVDVVLYTYFWSNTVTGGFNRATLGSHSSHTYIHCRTSLHSEKDTVWQSYGRGFPFFSAWHNVRVLMRKNIKKLPYRK